MRDLAAFLGEFERVGGYGLFGSYVNTDDRDSDRYLFHVIQGGLGLPDESYYRDEKFAEIREAYVAYLTRLLGLGGHESPEAARGHGPGDRDPAGRRPLGARRDPRRPEDLQPADADELRELLPGVRLGRLRHQPRRGDLDPSGCSPRCACGSPPTSATSRRCSTRSRSTTGRPGCCHLLRSAASYLTDDFVETNFDFYCRTLNGTPELRARWKRGVGFVEGALGEAVGQEYVARHFPPTPRP